MHWLIAFGLIVTAGLNSAECQTLDTKKAFEPYRFCMLKAVKIYSARAKSVDDAILAARADCDLERRVLLAALEANARISGESEYRAGDLAKRIVEKIDERLRPELARSVLKP